MLNFKAILAAASVAMSSYTMAMDKTIDVVTYFSQGGNGWERTEALISGLEAQGWKVNFVPQGNCSGLLNYGRNSGRAAVFFNNDAAINEKKLKGCNMRPESGQFVSVLYSRRNALCGPKDATLDQFVQQLNSGKTIKVSSSTFYPSKVVSAIGPNFVHVPYEKSSAATAGMLAGDADYMFTGMTKSVLKNDQLSCFAQGSQEDIPGMSKFTEVLPNFPYANLNVNYFASGLNLTPELRNALATDIGKMLKSDVWVDYITKSYMIPADKLNMTESDFLKSVDNWKP
jgi:hypothetical protein